MKKSEFYTTSEAARILGISRVAVFKKIKSGEISAEKFGRNYLIPADRILEASGVVLTDKRRNQIKEGVEKTVKEYRSVLERLGKE